MSWQLGYDENWKRDIGYGVPSYCDHPECNEVIHRGLAHVCSGGNNCGLYFCIEHLKEISCCEKCFDGEEPFEPKPDHPEWTNHKLTHPSWEEWRRENGITAQGEKN